jgi:DNA-directed RNA polymerase specialized sigma subunit
MTPSFHSSHKVNAREATELVTRAKTGDEAARNALMCGFWSYADKVARLQARRKNVDEDQAAGDAQLVVLDTIDRFDPERGAGFATYLAHRIRGHVTALSRAPEQNGIIDIRKTTRPSPKDPTPTQWETAWKAVGRPIADFWPLVAVRWVRGFRRRNDRMIAKWLWLDYPPKRQAEIAHRLGISRSAVFQRRRALKFVA